jgi:translation elongation factor EF-Tu-like GTPase
MPRMPTLDFEMIVSDVFVIAGRGIVASGEAVHGEFRSGNVAQIWHDDKLLSQSVAYVELHARTGTVAIILTDPNVHVGPGYLIKSTP